MDPHNETEFVSKTAVDYWENVDLYVGGSEHATGHLLYARFWHKFFADRGWVNTQEPFKKLVNQGMIQGVSAFVHRLHVYFDHGQEVPKGGVDHLPEIFISADILETIYGPNANNHSIELIKQKTDSVLLEFDEKFRREYPSYNGTLKSALTVLPSKLHVDISLLHTEHELNENLFRASSRNQDIAFIIANGHLKVTREVEKMSKSKYNVVNPDDIVEKFGADVLRMYEMFLGPIEQSKPWNTQGISGVSNFLRKLWRLFHNNENVAISEETPNEKELKALHTCIKKVNEDIEAFSFNTSVSAFMICVNELTEMSCNKRKILEPLTVLLAPFAPHSAEELWAKLGHAPSVTQAPYPVFEAKYLTESTKEYPVSFNGKVRFNLSLPATLPAAEVEKAALADERTTKFLEGKTIKKIIVVPGRIVNVVIG
jgi:leucyl-tRNA synthetase